MVKDQVLKWLHKTGFPLEMEAASCFRNAGFEISQGYMYADSESGKSREIDVLARDPDWLGLVNISFVVECKSSDKPWVVLTADEALYRRVFSFAVTSEQARTSLVDKFPPPNVPPYLENPNRSGYGFREAFAGKTDRGFGASVGLLKACKDMVASEHSFPTYSFAFPVIVVDTPLYECSLEESGDLSLKQVQKSEFMCRAHLPEEIGCCIKVVTKGSLEEYARSAKELANTIRADFKHEEETGFRSEDSQ